MWVPHKQHRPLLFLFFYFSWKGKMFWADPNTKGHILLVSAIQDTLVQGPLLPKGPEFMSWYHSCLGTMPAYQASSCCSAGFPYSLLPELFPAACNNNSWGQGGAEQVSSLGVKAQCQEAQCHLPHSAPLVGWLFAWLFTQCRAGSVGKHWARLLAWSK